MRIIDLMTLFSIWDYAAIAIILLAWIGIGWVIEHPGTRRPSVTVMMADYRRKWMRKLAQRDTRIFDAQILASLRQGTAFFASSSIFAIGGLLALIGSPDSIGGLAMSFSDATPPPAVLWQIKLIFTAGFVVAAFLKFVWANRLFGYCAVIMAAVPNDPAEAAESPRAALAGEINVRAALNFNRGLRAMYFALAALTWILGAVPLLIATAATVWVLWSREFSSLSQKLLEDRSD